MKYSAPANAILMRSPLQPVTTADLAPNSIFDNVVTAGDDTTGNKDTKCCMGRGGRGTEGRGR